MRKPNKAVVPPVIASWRKRSGLELIIKELSSTRQTSTSESHTTRAKWKDFDLKRKRRRNKTPHEEKENYSFKIDKIEINVTQKKKCFFAGRRKKKTRVGN